MVKQLEEAAADPCKATNMHMLWRVSLLGKARQILRVGGKVSEGHHACVPQLSLDLYFLNCFALGFEQNYGSR